MKFLNLSVAMAASTLLIASAFSSEYPGDYSTGQTCQTQGVVSVCRSIQPMYGAAVIEVNYWGSIQNNAGLTAWVKVNYQDGSPEGTFAMNHDRGPNSAFVRITAGCVTGGEEGQCSEQGTSEMANLLHWAQRQNMTLNALDLDVAFYDGSGNWDNDGSTYNNYHFSFPQQ